MLKVLKKNQKGITLIEMIIYVAIVSIVAFVFVNFTLDVVTSSQKGRIRKQLQENARFAMQRMIQTIRESNNVNTGSSTFGSHPGVLSLNMSNVALDPTVFDLNSGVLRIKEGTGLSQDITSDQFEITNLVFTNLSVTNRTVNIKIDLSMRHPNPENNEIYNANITLQGSAVIRVKEN